jgi:hypothetical protein
MRHSNVHVVGMDDWYRVGADPPPLGAPHLAPPSAAHVAPAPPPAGAPQSRFRARTIAYWDHWAQHHGDHGVEAYDPDIPAHAYDPMALGSFSLIRTNHGRYYALIRVHTVFGHLCLAIHLEREAVHQLAAMAHAAGEYTTSGFFDDIGHFVSHAASDIGHAVSKVAKDIGHGVSKVASDIGHGVAKAAKDVGHFVTHDVVNTAKNIGQGLVHAAQGAINGAAHAIESAAKAAGGAIDRGVKAAAHLVTRMHLGDINAGNIIRDIGKAAQGGLDWAKKAGQALADGAKFVAKAIDLPKIVADAIPIPAVQGFVKSIDPLDKFASAVDALKTGDWERLKKIGKEVLSGAQGVISLIPGIGTGISAAIGTAEALLEGGSPIDIAIRAAYGAIPIPPGLRDVTDGVLDAVLALLHGKDISDVALAVIRDRIPAGVPRDLFDTLANIVVKHQPILKATEDLASHYVKQYTQGIGDAVAQGISSVAPAVRGALRGLPDPSTVFAGFPKDLKGAVGGALGGGDIGAALGGAAGDIGKQLQGAVQGAAHDVANAASTALQTAQTAATSAATSAIGQALHMVAGYSAADAFEFGCPTRQPKPPPRRVTAVELPQRFVHA